MIRSCGPCSMPSKNSRKRLRLLRSSSICIIPVQRCANERIDQSSCFSTRDQCCVKEITDHEENIFQNVPVGCIVSCPLFIDESESGFRTKHDVHLPGSVAGWGHTREWKLRLAAHAVGCVEWGHAATATIAGDGHAHVGARDRWHLQRTA